MMFGYALAMNAVPTPMPTPTTVQSLLWRR